MNKVITSVNDLDFSLADIPEMPAPTKVLLVNPKYFAVEYVINPHMEGNLGEVDHMAAMNEWEHLKTAYEELGLETYVVDGVRGYPDMVFCANQSLPYITEDGTKKVLMSIMHTEQRAGEVPHIQKVYEESSYEVYTLNDDTIKDFEGMGDAIWHYKHRLMFGGYGFRTALKAYDHISRMFEIPVVAFELNNPLFYHLDTCFCSLNEDTVLIHPPAFEEEGLELIYKLIPNVIEANKYEAEELFACNATCPDGKNVFIQQGCVDVNAKLKDAGFNVHEFSTFEYLKSGGSVFCMKMLLW